MMIPSRNPRMRPMMRESTVTPLNDVSTAQSAARRAPHNHARQYHQTSTISCAQHAPTGCDSAGTVKSADGLPMSKPCTGYTRTEYVKSGSRFGSSTSVTLPTLKLVAHGAPYSMTYCGRRATARGQTGNVKKSQPTRGAVATRSTDAASRTAFQA